MTPPYEAPAGQAIEAARHYEKLIQRLRLNDSEPRLCNWAADELEALHAQNERLQGAISSAAGALLAGHDDRAYQILGEALMEPKP